MQQTPGGDKMVAFTRILHRTKPDVLMNEVGIQRQMYPQKFSLGGCPRGCACQPRGRCQAVELLAGSGVSVGQAGLMEPSGKHLCCIPACSWLAARCSAPAGLQPTVELWLLLASALVLRCTAGTSYMVQLVCAGAHLPSRPDDAAV